PPDAIGMTMLLNLHLAARYHDLGKIDKQLEALNRNLAMEARIPEEWREESPANAMIPVPSDKRSTKPRTISNLLAWSHVLAGYALVEKGKNADAEAQFKPVAEWFTRDSYTDAQALACNEMERLEWARKDPDRSRRKQWLASAKIMNRMTDEECNLA